MVIDAILDEVTNTLVARQQKLAHYECRRCGTTVSQDVNGCPQCGANEIACIRLK